MSDKTAAELFDEPDSKSAAELFEGGAEGGAPDSAPSKTVGQVGGRTATPIDIPDDPEREKQKIRDNMAQLSHGQGIPPNEQEPRELRTTAAALGEGIATARGTPLVGSHLDELSALLQTGSASGPAYQKKLGESRSAVTQAVKDNPMAPLFGSLAFAPALPSSAAGRIALGTASGVSEGVGSAPSMSEAVRPGLIGGAAGLGTSLVGEGLLAAGGVLRGKQSNVGRAATQKAAEKAFASARSGLGGETSSAVRTFEVLREAAQNPELPAELREAAKARLAEPDMIDLSHQAVRSNISRSYDQSARLAKARDAMAEAGQALNPDALEAARQARADDPSALIRRVRELGPKLILPAVGSALGGAPGAAAGGLVGAVLGRSATTVKNAMTDPYVASRVLGLGGNALKGAGAITSSGAPATSRAIDDYAALLHEENQ